MRRTACSIGVALGLLAYGAAGQSSFLVDGQELLPPPPPPSRASRLSWPAWPGSG